MPTLNTDRLKAIQEEQADITRRMNAILEASNERELEADEENDFDALVASLEMLKKKEKREQAYLASLPQYSNDGLTRSVNTQQGSEPRFGSQRESFEDDPNCGYATPREFLMDVMQTTQFRTEPSAQLKFLAAAGSDENSTQSDRYGGFLIPEGMAPGMLSIGAEGDPTAGRVTPVAMTSPVVRFNARVDKNHSTSVSGGLTVSRRAETQSPTASRMEFEQVKLEATGLFGLSYASEELLERSPISFVSILEAGFGTEFGSKMLKEKISGTGVGEALGILNSDATISVAKESAQSADTINGTNIIKMRSRAYNYSNCIWLANHDTYTQLVAAHTALTNDDYPLFVHGNGTDVPDTLLGRPIFFTEYAKTLGDKGDLILADWSQYLWGTLGGTNPRRADSMHVRFLNHERTFKFWLHNDGQPWWRSALTPVESSTTLSPFVVLAERA